MQAAGGGGIIGVGCFVLGARSLRCLRRGDGKGDGTGLATCIAHSALSYHTRPFPIPAYISTHRVTTVRETTKMVSLDNNKSTTNTLMSRLKGLVGNAPPPDGFPRPVLELVTSGRVFVLSPATIIMPPPMTTSMSLGPSATGKPLYLFGWPFPVPPLDEEDDEVGVVVVRALWCYCYFQYPWLCTAGVMRLGKKVYMNVIGIAD